MHSHHFDGFFAAQEFVLSTFQLSLLVADHGNRVRKIAVVNFDRLSVGCCPDHVVAVGRHHVQHFQLTFLNHKVCLPVDKLQTGPTAKDAVAVGRSIDVVPDMIFGQYGFPRCGHFVYLTKPLINALLCQLAVPDDICDAWQ